jgi:uncharacterized protein (DUF952 family)
LSSKKIENGLKKWQGGITMRIFKILSAADWQSAVKSGVYRGSPIDLADGFIHFSTAAQVQGTAAKHFAGQSGLMLIAFDADALAEHLTFEPSRGGQLFPHLYGTLNPALALAAVALPWDGTQHIFPKDVIAEGTRT